MACTFAGLSCWDARYVETGHLVYALNGVVVAVAFDPDAREVLGGPVPLVEGVRDTTATGAAQFSVARNGSLVYAPIPSGGVGEFSLSWMSATGEETPIAAPPGNYGDMRISPDGTRIAVEVSDENSDVWIWHLDDGPLTRLTFSDVGDVAPLWTPDGARVVFASSREGGGLFWKAADGTGEVERLLESASQLRPWGWSTDGQLVFTTQQPEDIGVLSVEGDRTVQMLLETEFRERSPAVSPDGQWIAYQSDESGRNEIYVQPFPNVDDGKWQVSTNVGSDPVWSPDGRRLFFNEQPIRMMVAEVQTDPTFSRGTPTEVFPQSGLEFGGGGRRYDLAPDGERFVVRRSGGAQTTGEETFDRLIVVEHWFEELKRLVPID